MTHEEIIAIARAAGFDWDDLGVSDRLCFERFAALVAAAEREACAALIEGTTERRRWIRGGINGETVKPCEYAAAIRARSKP